MNIQNNKKNEYCVSEYNQIDDVKKYIKISPKLSIVDCTLRDGEQQAGIVFTKEDKVNIAKKLDELGIPEIEVGMPAVSEEDQKATKEIVNANLNARIIALSRPIKEDIDLLSDCGVWGATISLPIGDLQRKYKLNWTDEKYIDTTLKITKYAKEKGLYVNLSPYDTTRTNFEFMKKVFTLVAKEGTVDRIRLVDTVGAAMPLAIKYLVREMKKIVKNIPIEIHCHDDFGLATACTLAGAEEGAEFLSTTINGIGERSGNAATEEVLVALKILYGIDIGVKLEKLVEVSRLVENLSGIKLHQHKSIVGKNSFAHESGMVVAGVLKMPFVGEAYNPEIVGQKRKILIGKKSGTQSINAKLKELNINIDSREILKNILNDVKTYAILKKRALTNNELITITKKYSD